MRSTGEEGKGTYITLPTDHLLAIIFGGERFQARFDDTAAKTEDEVEGAFLYPFPTNHHQPTYLIFSSFTIPQQTSGGRDANFTFWIL